jgi:hypothetical protein
MLISPYLVLAAQPIVDGFFRISVPASLFCGKKFPRRAKRRRLHLPAVLPQHLLRYAPACLVIAPNGGKNGKDYPSKDEPKAPNARAATGSVNSM